jgi:hypothetical protein
MRGLNVWIARIFTCASSRNVESCTRKTKKPITMKSDDNSLGSVLSERREIISERKRMRRGRKSLGAGRGLFKRNRRGHLNTGRGPLLTCKRRSLSC